MTDASDIWRVTFTAALPAAVDRAGNIYYIYYTLMYILDNIVKYITLDNTNVR